ncbi:S8 family serine peptidase [Luteimonas sp. RD2P54]|uniref:S8 family serine peptidase n=1 Tax=Luteimonas endophytica TaxID=3042023 RepID=A0ABT6JB87_9GAMM|nr:S8 family serine peptidase [Luteimonas endophytica]MDH5823433.1 S8 family serine peptidase [Luteimonas endophytica]
MAEQTPRAVAAPSCKLSLLALAVGLALSACGGGGGDNRPDPPPTERPPPPPTTVEPPNPDYSEHLALTNTYEAHDAGLSGEGVRIGVLDTGVNRDHPALAGRVVDNLVYVDGADNDLSVDDVDGHGTAVAQILAGTPFGEWPGGIAPGAEIVSARIINDEPPDDDGSGDGNEVDGPLGLEPIHQDMIDRGVRILNNSWGGLYWDDPAATALIADEYRDFIFDNDGLVVFATGNLEDADPTDMAALPSQPGPNGTTPAADLERGWLAVTAIDPDDVHQLDSLDDGTVYPNACGVAMNYCLAAPGTVVVTGTDDAPDAPDYYGWAGTSFAAPQVSGAAALVWEAFPWFDNDLVRQTLLGTAADIGDPGVDEVFGYGLLDVGRAVQGPGRFDWGRVTADFDGMSSEWSNDIAGSGGLTKRGTGLLELSGDNDYRGETRVEDGVLRLSGALNNSAVSITGNGVLSGAGAIAGSVDNAGTVFLDAGDGDTALTVGGDYRHRDGAQLALLFGAGALQVGGDAAIEGGTVHVAGVIDGYTTRREEEVLRTEGTLSGAFDEYTFDDDAVFFEGELVHDYIFGRVLLEIDRLDVFATASAFGSATAASLSAAERVENAFRQIDGQREAGQGLIADGFIRTAGEFQSIPDEATAAASLASLSGELHALASSATFDAIDMSRRALTAQFGQAAPGQAARGARVWQRQLGGGGQGGFSGSEFAVDGWMIGREHRFGGNGVAGFAFGETHADSRRDGSRDRGRDRQAQAQLYAGRLHGNGYTLGQAGFGRFDRQLERHLFTGRQSTGVATAYAGDFFTVNLESGYRFGDRAAAVTPYVGAEYTRIDSDGFFEPGADGFGLRADPWTSSRSQAIAGLRAERGWRGLTLHGYAEWQHTLGASGLDVDAAFTGADAWSSLGGLQPGRSGGLFGLGLDAWVGRSGLVTLGWDQRFGPRGDARMVSLRYALGF